MDNNKALLNEDMDFDFEDFSELENNAKSKKTKKVKVSKPKKPLNKAIIIGAIATVVVIGAVCVVLNMSKNSDKNIIFATNKEDIEGMQPVDLNGDNSNSVSTDINGKILAFDESIKIPVIVNTKLDGDTTYKDYNTYVELKYNQILLGYDKVESHVNYFNSTSTNKLNLPNKSEFYAQETPSELVMVELTFSVPEDFPSSDIEHKYVGIKPSIKLGIKGTEQEDKLVTDNYVYSLPEFKTMCDDISTLHLGETYSLKYIAVFPKGIDSSKYELYITYTEDDTNYTFKLTNVDMPKLDEK